MRPVQVLAVVALMFLAALVAPGAHGSSFGAPPRPDAHVPLTPSSSTTPSPTLSLRHDPTPLVAGYTTIIEPNGTLTNASAPITVRGDNYTLTAMLAGTIVDERNGSVLDGNGFLLAPPATAPEAVEVWGAVQVTVQGFNITSSVAGIYLQDDARVTLDSNRVAVAGWAVSASASSSLVIGNNTAPGTDGIELDQVSGGLLVGNDLPRSQDDAVAVLYSSDITLENNDASGSSDGLYAYESETVVVRGNDFTSTSTGIDEVDVGGSYLVSNELGNASYGVLLTESSAVSATNDSGTHDTWGVYAGDDANLSLTDERFPNASESALYVYGSTEVNITGGELLNANVSAVSVIDAARVLLQGFNLSGFGVDGLVVDSSTGVQLVDSVIGNGRASSSYAVEASSSSDLLLTGDTLSNAGGGFQDGGSSNVTLTGCSVNGVERNGTAIRLEGDRNVALRQDMVQDLTGLGVDAASTVGLSIVNSHFSRISLGAVVLAGTSGARVMADQFSDWGRVAINASLSNSLTVSGNYLTDVGQPTGVGIEVDNSSGGAIIENTVVNASTALVLTTDQGLQALWNNASRSATGFEAEWDVNVTLAADSFFQDRLGFSVAGNSGLWVYHDNFISDDGWFSGETPPQFVHWDAGYPMGGNYWSNHTTPDVMSGPGQNVPDPLGDGIVDTPVPIDARSADRYPLTTPWMGYFVEFVATGLYSGSSWTVVVNGVPYTSLSSTILYPQTDGPNATFTFVIPRPAGYGSVTPSTGGGVEQRANLTVPVTLVPRYYSLTFQEYGLPSGTFWTMIAAGIPSGSNSTTITLRVPNGTFNYVPGSVPGYLAYGGSGLIQVNDSSVVVPNGTTSEFPVTLVTLLAVAVGLLLVAVLFLAVRGRRPPPPKPPVPFPVAGPTLPDPNDGSAPPPGSTR